MRIIVADDIRTGTSDAAIHAALVQQQRIYASRQTPFQSLAVMFAQPGPASEAGFEAALWARLQQLTRIDELHGYDHDPIVSPDPQNPEFAVSFGGAAFFVVGLHRQASRPARRFARPVMVFNVHAQFDQLRREGVYDKLQAAIEMRDLDLAGSRNPMLGVHGEISAARQYSGRRVADEWICPFHRGDTLLERI